MKIHLKLAALALLLSTINYQLSTCFAQGSLTPPGAPAPTMKTLSEIEPRIAITATNTPGDGGSVFKITQGGSYYLTGNIAGVSGKAGIQIAVPVSGPGVSIDLMGFEVIGVPGSTAGISSESVADARNISIRNGTIRAWGGSGIDILNSRNNRLADLRVQGNGGKGMLIGSGSSITSCTADSNSQEGIRAADSCSLTGCSASFNTNAGILAVYGSTVTGCACNYNGGKGIQANAGGAVVVTACAAINNASDGIAVSAGGTVSGSTASENTGNGILASSFDCNITGCTALQNTGNGILASSGCTITGCTASQNTGNGILVGDSCSVTGNICRLNGVASGIYCSGNRTRIENNHVTGNGAGIAVAATAVGNIVIRNYASANTSNYSLPAGNNFVGTLTGTSAAMNAAPNSTVNISYP